MRFIHIHMPISPAWTLYPRTTPLGERGTPARLFSEQLRFRATEVAEYSIT